MKFLRAAFLLSLIPILAYGHARWAANSAAVPRNNNPGLKTGPCGGIARTATPTALTAKANMMLRWEETIDHKSVYYIEFSPAGDTNWVRLQTIPDIQDGALSGGAVHSYSLSVAVPDMNCTACTLRIIQEMRDAAVSAANPTGFSGNYFSCADIQITGSTAGAGGGNMPPIGPVVADDPTPPEVAVPDTCHPQ